MTANEYPQASRGVYSPHTADSKNPNLMTASEIMSALKAKGSEQTRKTYRRHGVSGEMFGVSYGDLDKLTKEIRKQGASDAAAELWQSGNHDAKVLATKILDPRTLSRSEATTMAGNITHGLQSSGLAEVVSKTDFAPSLAEKWVAMSPTRSPMKVLLGWNTIASIAVAKKHHLDCPDEWFSRWLEVIGGTLQDSPNDLRHEMNQTLIAIGSRNEQLRDQALATAKRVGKVEVDHGETACKTPNAKTYIEKVWARRK